METEEGKVADLSSLMSESSENRRRCCCRS